MQALIITITMNIIIIKILRIILATIGTMGPVLYTSVIRNPIGIIVSIQAAILLRVLPPDNITKLAG